MWRELCYFPKKIYIIKAKPILFAIFWPHFKGLNINLNKLFKILSKRVSQIGDSKP